ncbi:MAG TPA: hypothetical protein VIW69_12715 [Candidatus Elarobacter sp.]
MLTPITIHADLEAGAYEITYRRLPRGKFIDHDERVAPGVTAGIGPRGQVIGIELLGLEASTLTAARDYAAAHGLGFPQHLPGLLVAS